MGTWIQVADVRAIYAASELTDPQLEVHIGTAELEVQERLIAAGCVMSEDRRDKIAAYLAAHFAYISEQNDGSGEGPLRRSKLGDADESYAVPSADSSGYQGTRYGQTALALDPCGYLSGSTANFGLKARFRIV